MPTVLRYWSALRPKHRAIGGALLALAVAAFAFAFFLQRDLRVPLFATPIDQTQIAEVTQRLAAWNTAFIATPDNVRVDASARNDLLLKLSLAGLPHTRLDSTTEALAKAGPLVSQSVLEAQQRVGLAGDIAAGLRGLTTIADARVIIAPSDPATFADESGHDATASVRLSLRPGATLDRETAGGIRAYVAAAVPGLSPTRVALLDDRGSTLGDGSANGVASSDEAAALAASLQSALDLAFGAGATIVRARILYDPRSRESRETVRKPLGSRPITQTSSDEHYASTSKRYGKTSGSVDRGTDEQEEKIDTPAGRVERLSVAVAVDAARHLDVRKIRSLAMGTLGLVSSRGDMLSVEEIAFTRAPSVRPIAAWMLALGSVVAIVPSLAFAGAIVTAMRFGAKPLAGIVDAMSQRVALGRATRGTLGYAPDHVRGALRGEPPHTAAAIISALPAATATAVLEMYSPQERAAIVRRMARAATPAVPDHETILRRG